MALTQKETELTAIGASIGAGCHPCLKYHIEEASRAGLDRETILQAVADAECVKRGAYNEQAVAARELLGEQADLPPSCCDDTNVAKEFVSLGSAIGANSLAQFEKHVEQGKRVGLTEGQIAAAVEVARSIQGRAAEITVDEAAKRLGGAPRRHEPIFLTAAPVIAAETCGADCACHGQAAASACGCAGDQAAAVGGTARCC